MAMPNESSFRRILISRIVILFIPVLWIGQILALNKARSTLLENTRQNLTHNAVEKGEKIADDINAIKTHLYLASQTRIIQSGLSSETQQFFNQLRQEFPKQVECLQLTNLETGNIIASTCSDSLLPLPKSPFVNESIQIETILPRKKGATAKRFTRNQLELLFSAPVLNESGKLNYVLTLQSVLKQQTNSKVQGLADSTIIIDQDGKILAHQLADRVGTNIEQHPDASRIRSILQNALAGREDTVNLSFKDRKELVAGYTAIANPIVVTNSHNPPKKWVILSVTALDSALFGLGQIKLTLFIFTAGLIITAILAALYLSRQLALPIEKLRDYALNVDLNDAAPVPYNFQIREFNQLGLALEQMIDRLQAWAEELEIAWQDAKKANQVKSQFLATTSHELRNPLNIIINCIRVVRDDLCDNKEEELEFLKRADDTAIHLLGIINDLLDISKIEAGKLSVVKEPIELAQLLKDVVNLQSFNIQQKGLLLKCDIHNGILPVMADPIKLKQVLINVIGNATKFTEEGSISITTNILEEGDVFSVAISVQDTGIGIDPTQQDKLFRPFMRVDGGTTRKFAGTGLGLAISRNLMELMGGSIFLESAGINLGTKVTVSLPLIDAELLPVLQDNAKEKAPFKQSDVQDNLEIAPLPLATSVSSTREPTEATLLNHDTSVSYPEFIATEFPDKQACHPA